MKKLTLIFLVTAFYHPGFGQNVQITVQTLSGRRAVSPYIYGRNNSLSGDPTSPVPAVSWQLYKDAGVSFFRENGGNDLTKNNWRLKLSSHPDWYNNVYGSDWDYAALSLQQNIPSAQGMWGFQLIGQAASTTTQNFDDWDFNQSQWWSGVEQNLAGGGIANTGGGSMAMKNGDTSLYLEHWPADSTTGIIGHWFGSGGLGLDSGHIQYWNMDNEVEIWSSTHDDVMPAQPSAEAFLQSYFSVARKARALFPTIKLTGPVSPNEWQWYNWNNATVTGSDGKQYPWLQYFIKRVAEEEAATGVRLLDVIDLHFYPGSSSASNVVQYHRVFFDSSYAFPEANGVKVVNGSWDNSIQIEDVFGRCQNWLNQYLGPGNGVGVAVSEAGTQLQNNPNALAVWYAGTMGEFMKHGIEYFSPWNWDYGMWETVHLFSRYNKNISVTATSSDEQDVSAYVTADAVNDSLTVALVNRSLTQTETVTLSFPDFQVFNQPVTSLTLSGLPVGRETFVSHTNNALVTSAVTPSANTLQVTMAPMSMTSLLIAGTPTPLPVKLLSFTASPEGSAVVLHFTTTNEIDLAGFYVERSGDGQTYATLGYVPASAGMPSGESQLNYAFTDRQPLADINYYRLGMVDQDGHSTYGPIDVIRFAGDPGGGIILFPNPAKDVLNVEVTLPAGPAFIQITDAAGHIVRTVSVQGQGGVLSTSIDLNGLARGIYYLSVGNDSEQFMKQ